MGKTSVVFVEQSTVAIIAKREMVFRRRFLVDIDRARCGHYKWTLQQQDGAPSHTARSTVQYVYLQLT